MERDIRPPRATEPKMKELDFLLRKKFGLTRQIKGTEFLKVCNFCQAAITIARPPDPKI